MGCPTCLLTGRAPKTGDRERAAARFRAQAVNGAPGTAFRRGTQLALTGMHGNAASVRASDLDPASTTGNEPQNGEEAGQGVRRATCS